MTREEEHITRNKEFDISIRYCDGDKEQLRGLDPIQLQHLAILIMLEIDRRRDTRVRSELANAEAADRLMRHIRETFIY